MEMEDGQQQQHQYRDKSTVDEDFVNYPKDARQRRILSAMPMQYSKGSMTAKAALLEDLLSQFKVKVKPFCYCSIFFSFFAKGSFKSIESVCGYVCVCMCAWEDGKVYILRAIMW